MNISDLVSFADHVRQRSLQMVEATDRFARYFGGKDSAKDLSYQANHLHETLVEEDERLRGKSRFYGESKIYDKKTGIFSNRLLLRLEYLLCEIKAFDEEEDSQSKLIEMSVIEATTVEASHLRSEIFWKGYHNADYAVREKVVGRDYESLMNQVVEVVIHNYGLTDAIPILGKPGMGKSALARLVFNNDRVRNHFKRCHWRSGTDVRTPEDLMTAVLESSAEMNDKVLVVLDGLSEMDLFNSLFSDDKTDTFQKIRRGLWDGTAILVTSRYKHPVEGAFAVSLPSLDDNESWDLFKDIASPNPEILPILSSVGFQICQKCKNIPGIINIMASVMSSKTTQEEWKHFLDVVLTSVPDPRTTLSSAYVLITDRDKKKQRRCFYWCSLLPMDYEFRRDYLFYFLKAQPFDGETSVTDKDLDHFFTKFVSGGFFVKCDSVDSITKYKVSYLGHELMKHLAGEEFCLVDTPATEPDYKTVRHASFIVDSEWEPPSWLSKARLLRTLMLWPRISGEFISLPTMDLSHMRELHTADFKAVHFESLPLLFGKSQEMKCLTIGRVFSISVPDDIPTLCVLLNSNASFDGELKSLYLNQTMESINVGCWKKETCQWAFDELSVLLRDLISITISNCSECQHLPAFNSLPHLSSLKLWNLLSLVKIVINNDKTEASSTRMFYPSLKVLALCDLPELKGWSNEEADSQQQYVFPVLTQVRVRGCPKLTSMPPVPMLTSLEAINSNAKLLKELIYREDLSRVSESSTYIKDSVSSPDWLIQKLEIDSCQDLYLGGNPNDVEKGVSRGLRNLRSLKLKNSENTVSLPVDPDFISTLEQLSLDWLTNLKVLPEWTGQFTQLRQLSIHYCVNLISLPKSHGSFSTLQQLDIRYCPRLSQFPESLPSLKKLRVQENCRFEDLLRASHNLEELEIDNCDEGDSSVGIWGGLESLHTLKFIKMESLPNSPDFGKLSKLRQVFIRHCPDLTTLPDSLCSLQALEELNIKNCPRLTHLPQEFPKLKSLKHLEIRVSSQLEKTCQKSSGEEWHLIQHIPIIKCDKWSHLEIPVCFPDSETNALANDLKVVRPKRWVAARKTLAKVMHLC